MPKPLKYREGEQITDPIAAVKEILAGRYIIVDGKRQHPAFMASQSLHLVALTVQRREVRFAIPTTPDLIKVSGGAE